MTATNEPRPRVNDEDRDQAVALAAESIRRRNSKPWKHSDMQQYMFEAGDVIDALVSELAWGPKPTVSPTKLGEFIDAANAGGMAVPWRGLQDYLRECGIEVTDGD